METFLKDVRQSSRMFLRSPGFTLTAVAALAIGIGANTAIFSVINTVLLRPLPYPDADRLVILTITSPQGSFPGASVTKYNIWRERTDVFEEISAVANTTVNLIGVDNPEQLLAARVTASMFRVFGLAIAHGRGFTAEEDRPGGPNVAVLSDDFWTRRFGRDSSVVGKTISLSGDAYQIVGVAAPENKMEANPPIELYLPFQIDPASTDQADYFTAFARLRRGVTPEMAAARLKLSADQFRRKYSGHIAFSPRDGFGVRPMHDLVVSGVRDLLRVLAAAVGCVLLIACANVANLLLVRATGRRREIAIRAAIGAARGRIVRQLLTESVALAFSGGVLGLALGWIGIRSLLPIFPGSIPRLGPHNAYVALDWHVLVFTLLASILTGVLFGLIPAVEASRTDLTSVLKESGGRSGTGFRQNKARSLLVIAEMALALILLIGAALLIRTYVALRSVNPGFDRSNVLTLQMSVDSPQLKTSKALQNLLRNGTERLQALAGVEAVGATCWLPLEGGYDLPFIVAGRPLDGPSHGSANWMDTSAGYFNVFKIPIRRGRVFTDRDDGTSAPVAIINQAMAKKFWPSGDPLSDRIIVGKGVGPEFEEPARQIVGIVGDSRDDALNRDPRPIVYVPTAQVTDGFTALKSRLSPLIWVVRTRVPPLSLSAPIQHVLREVSAGLPVARIRSMDEVVSLSTAREDFNMLLLNIFAGSALLLAAIGIYGLMAYSVAQRTQEIGIRMALGAEIADVRRMVVRQGMTLALIGVAIGVAASFGLTRVISSFLFGVKAWDPAVFVLVPLLLSAVALLAVWVPARRATRIDPLDALRYE
ncbi:MAG TPA: ABC transporter permease [Bryobacteraceae bacterium]|nr:ABC transporter permease [Bryobacteraceae bacterium]